MGEKQATDTEELPPDVIDEIETLTRRARTAGDPNEADAYREKRRQLLDPYDFTARVREKDDTLVLYPSEWVEDGTVQPDRIDDTDRGIERPLSGTGETDHWEETETHNRRLAAQIEADHGSVHGANAHALADFASNHYAKPVEQLTATELQEFLDEYFIRNVWPSDDQKDAVEKSVRLVFEAAETDVPTERAR